MDQNNHTDENNLPTNSHIDLIEVPLTPDEQAYTSNLPTEKSNIDNNENTIQPAESIGDAPEKKRLTDRQKKLAAFILAGLILAGIVTGTIFANSKGKGQPTTNPTPTMTEPNKNPTTTQTPTTQTKPTSPETSPTTIQNELPLTVENLELDSSLLSNPEILASKFNELITEWINSGATKENTEKAFASNMELNEYAEILAAEYDDICIKALLIDGWESDPALMQWVNKKTLIHSATLSVYFKTQNPVMGDYEPYKRWYSCEDIESFSVDGSDIATLIISNHQQDNSDKNRALALFNGESADEVYFEEITFITDSGKLKVSQANAYR